MSSIGGFYVIRTGTDAYNLGMTTDDKGISLIVETLDDGTELYGIEADLVRVRTNASANDRLAGVQTIGGLTWVALDGQIKDFETI